MSLFNYGKLGGLNKNEPLSIPDKTKSSATAKENQNSNASKISNSDFAPKRFGLVYDPPTIILEYLVPSSGKLYHHKMKLLKLKGDSDSQEMVDYCRKRHTQYFSANKISDEQIIALIDRLKKKLPKGNTVGSASAATTSKSKDALDLLFDSKLGKKEDKKSPLTLASSSNNETGGGVKLGKLAPLASNSNNKTTANNKIEEDDIFSKTSTNFWDKNKAAGSNMTSSSNNKKEDKPKSADFWGSEDDDEEIDYNHTNLNKLSSEELKKHKDKMTVLFNKNQKKPGDPDFVYDKQEEFDPQEDNEWDEDI